MFWLVLWKVRLVASAVSRIRQIHEPVIPSGSGLTIEPIDRERIALGDIVLRGLAANEKMLPLLKMID